MTLAPLMSSAQQDWRTPRDLFRAVDALAGGFTLDAAADAENHLVPRWLGPGSYRRSDALTCSWVDSYNGERVWLNPPYGRDLPKFAAKAVAEVTAERSLTVWMLVPARVDTRWWKLLMERADEVRFIAGRVRFETAEGAKDAAPFPSAIVRLRHDGGNPRVVWGWRP